MDVKSAFFMEPLKKRITSKQKDDGIFISQDKYVAEILRKFGFIDVKSASIPIETEKPLLKDPDGKDVDVHIYRSMIGSLMFLASSKPDIMFAVYDAQDSKLYQKCHICMQLKRFLVNAARHFITAASYELMFFGLLKVVAVNSMLIGYEKPPPKLTFYKVFFSEQWKFLIHTLVQCLSAKTAWNEFSCSMASVAIYLATVVMDHQADDMTTHNTRYTSPALTQKVFPNMMRVRKGFSAEEESNEARKEKEVKVFRVKKAEKGCKGVSDVSTAEPTVFDGENVTMTMAQTLIKLKAEKAKVLDEQIAQKLHDEEVQKATARDEQERADMKRALELQRQYDDKEKNIDWSVVAEQVQERHLDSIRKYQNLKKKPDSIAQARKNMIIYLKNMAGYKIEFFRGMTYDKVRPIFEREYKNVQTLFKPDKDVQEIKKIRVADETLLQESFKKLKAAEVLGSKSTQEIPSNNPKEMNKEDVHNMLEIVPVPEFKVELYRKLQVEKDNEMAKDLVMKIFMEANKPRSRMLLDKVSAAAEVLKIYSKSLVVNCCLSVNDEKEYEKISID
uniref:Ribonuclease H-like domain, reverse transcriptase, RNA-dependent DNA polymerase n=1 Tax=Tanacetum cinerariifolium TaxID=118510 RepID=A0A6L2KVB5_TANCI|nr:ribonuclease H-like domain, reverse transcriptase, RNA-dependent DNA polymerase [Tanacetum cinerariifolium]